MLAEQELSIPDQDRGGTTSNRTSSAVYQIQPGSHHFGAGTVMTSRFPVLVKRVFSFFEFSYNMEKTVNVWILLEFFL